VSGYEFFSAETRDNPFPLFDRLRDHDPVYETDFGYWYVSRYNDVVTLLRDTRLTSGRGVPDSLGVTGGPLRTIMDSWLMARDGPTHRRARSLVSRAFTPRAVEAMRPAITATAGRLVCDLVEAGGGDVNQVISFPLPMEVTRLLFGVDPGTWDAEVTAIFDPARRSGDGWVSDMQRLVAFLTDFVPRWESDGSGLFSALKAPDEEGNVLSELEQIANAVLLVTAGFETTMSLISNAVRTLLLHPDQLAVLRATPSLVGGAVDEVLRFEPPALWTSRFTTEAIDVIGTVIPAESNVLFSSVAANRDPARYTDPARFDITRADIRPVTFGGGVHSCIGAQLARVETEVVLTALFERAPSLRLVEPVGTAFQDANPSVRRPVALPVAL
jgi:cytochrome P450